MCDSKSLYPHFIMLHYAASKPSGKFCMDLWHCLKAQGTLGGNLSGSGASGSFKGNGSACGDSLALKPHRASYECESVSCASLD